MSVYYHLAECVYHSVVDRARFHSQFDNSNQVGALRERGYLNGYICVVLLNAKYIQLSRIVRIGIAYLHNFIILNRIHSFYLHRSTMNIDFSDTINGNTDIAFQMKNSLLRV